jgi:hypothetical protein
MAFDFPSSPTPGQRYPAPPLAGIPSYAWDGEKWTSVSGAIAPGAPPSSLAPLMDGIAAPGTALEYTRDDHVHPRDTARAPVADPTFTGTLTAQNFVVTGNSHLAAISAETLAVPGSASLAGITATQFTVSGTSTFTGVITATAKGHQLGTYGGAVITSPLAQGDANILLYAYTDTNWAGIGTDVSGAFWIRTGLSGTPVAAFSINGVQVANFLKSPTAPNPSAADNSTKLATTAWVNANAPAAAYLPLSGGTINGNLTIANADLYSRRADPATGILFLNSALNRYLYADNVNYTLANAPAIAGNGRLWGTSDFSAPVVDGRMAFGLDLHLPTAAVLNEPLGGGVITGAARTVNTPSTGHVARFRYMQLCTTSWFTIGYA